MTDAEIKHLKSNGCTCEEWGQIQVKDGFDPSRVRAVNFSGTIRLGRYDGERTLFGGLKRPTGIYSATLHNCHVGDNVLIHRVENYIANYIIEENVIIDTVDLMAVDGESTFGNGTEVAVLNESGGRKIPIYDHLNAQIAYFLALYRHRKAAIEQLEAMIEKYVASVQARYGRVGAGARICHAHLIKNVKIGPAAVIEGATRLESGSINSCVDDPVYIGPGVIAENFIVCSGSKISDNTLIAECFVGQGCELNKHYSAENSVFFANCAGVHGEACSIFAGPFTVTHHKSTLLIAGLFSFLNAGSGSNQSNHMYKLGPLHQGIVERGSKTTSDSYMLWPAHVGPFTLVMGRHYRNSDTSDLPFSYLIESNDESVLIPGVNLRSVGTVRDARKWPKRDKRKDPDQLDFINYYLLSPFTIQKMITGRRILQELTHTSGETSDFYSYNNVKIKNSSLINGITFYEIGIIKFLGNTLIRRLKDREFASVAELRRILKAESDIGKGKWLDLVGLIAPNKVIHALLTDIESGRIDSLDGVMKALRHIHENYPIYEWNWTIQHLENHLGKSVNAFTPEDIIGFTEQWISAVIKLDHMLREDARKEFSLRSQTGFGIDGDRTTREEDFLAVRGVFDENSFVKDIDEHIRTKSQLADDLIARMKKLQ